ncbi:MAG TPA: hypothetical protein DCS67_08290 [Clostridiales bacterium UBA8960]|nr:hypothetical protein [Clostridiales bacterium UBA8960]
MRLSNEEAQKLIHTLRSGTSPLYQSNAFICGREKELDEYHHCLKLLDKGNGLVKLITGQYGMGKSLLVNAFKQIALNEDFIVSSFQINNGFRLNKIEDLYYAIMHNLTLKDNRYAKSSFEDIFELWVENLQGAPYADRKRYEVNTVCQELSRYNMNFARAFLTFMRGRIQRNQEMTNVASAWLTGEHHIPFELKQKYNLSGAVDKTSTLDFLKAFVKLITLLDYKGLVVFIDEIDLVLGDRSDFRQNAYNNLKHLIDMTSTGEMTKIMFVFSGTDQILTNTEKGILSNTPLAQRLNFDSVEALEQNSTHQTIMPLSSLNANELIELTRRIVRIYRQNAPLPETLDDLSLYAQIVKSINESTFATRTYVTKLIERLDYASNFIEGK